MNVSEREKRRLLSCEDIAAAPQTLTRDIDAVLIAASLKKNNTKHTHKRTVMYVLDPPPPPPLYQNPLLLSLPICNSTTERH